MTKQTINVGDSANDKKGDSLRSAFQKVNSNFTELYVALGLDSGGLNLGAFEFTGSTISTTDSSSILIDQATVISSNLSVGGDLLPVSPMGGNIGSASNPWKSLYVSNNTIYIGNTAVSVNQSGQLTVAGSQVNSIDRLTASGDEVVLVGGANPYVTFPAITGGDQLIIQGAEVSSVSGSLALTSQDNLNIIANGSGAAPGGSKNWTFSADGSLTIPGDIRSEQEINIDINLGDSTLRRWTFGEDGVLNAPTSSGLYNTNLFDIRSESNYTAWVRTSGQIGLASINSTGVANVAKVEAISTQPAHVDITVESSGQGSKVWNFDYVGGLTIPGGILSIDHLNLDADYDNGYSVYIGSNHPTAGTLGGVVIGDTRGGFVEIITTKLIIGQTSVPTHSYGSPGDIEGEVAFDNNYIYYCKQNYVNNSTDIWVRVGWTSSTW